MGRRPLGLQDQEHARGSVVDDVFKAVQQGQSTREKVEVEEREREREREKAKKKLYFSLTFSSPSLSPSPPSQNFKNDNATDPTFDPKAEDQVSHVSSPRDPAPLVPAVAGQRPFGSDIEIVNIIVVISLQRLWQYFLISAVVPVLTATLLSFVVFAVPPNKLDTRLQTATGLFLALIAIQVSFQTLQGETGTEGRRRRRRSVAAKERNKKTISLS